MLASIFQYANLLFPSPSHLTRCSIPCLQLAALQRQQNAGDTASERKSGQPTFSANPSHRLNQRCHPQHSLLSSGSVRYPPFGGYAPIYLMWINSFLFGKHQRPGHLRICLHCGLVPRPNAGLQQRAEGTGSIDRACDFLQQSESTRIPNHVPQSQLTFSLADSQS